MWLIRLCSRCFREEKKTQTQAQLKTTLNNKLASVSGWRGLISKCKFYILPDASTAGVTYDYGYGRTYDTSKTYYQQAPTTATYAAAAQPYADTTAQPAPKVTGYQTAQYVAGPTRNNIQPQQPKAPVPTASYNTNQGYTSQPAYTQNAQGNTTVKRK